MATTLGALNPFRYRGYVYDEETEWYYLKSRYYDPETCRFISADVLLSTGQGVLGHNCYAYCLNNPVNRRDSTGRWSFFDGGNKENTQDGSGVGYCGNIDFSQRSWDNPYNTGESANKNNIVEEPTFDSNQQAVIGIAKDYSRGIYADDANILVDWANEYGLTARGPEIHENRSGWAATHWHIHVGPVNHILVLER